MTGRRYRSALTTIVMMVAGGVAALTPVTVQAAAARLFSVDQQAAIAIAAGTGAFLAAVVGAAVLESRLAEPSLSERTYLPLWATLCGVAGGAVLAVFPTSAVGICLGLPATMVALQLGRTHAITQTSWKNEALAAILLLTGIVSVVVLIVNGISTALTPLGIASAGAVIARAVGSPATISSRPRAATVVWVTSETAVVAAVPYATSFVVLAFLGPSETVAFRLVLSALGVLQPILGYLRTRLLGAHSPSLIIAAWVLSAAALSTLVLLDVLGAFSVVFGLAWSAVSLPSLVIACCWKLVTIPETVPFANLRRRGSVRTVFAARATSAVANVAITLCISAFFKSLLSVFVGFLIAQIFTVLLYRALDRRNDPSSGAL